MRAVARRALARLARRHGIQLAYQTNHGEQQAASPETLLAVLQALGQPIRSPDDAVEWLRTHQAERDRHAVEPVEIAWNGAPVRIPLRGDTNHTRWKAELRLEDGTRRRIQASVRNAAGLRFGRSASTAELVLPNLPLGYHHLDVATKHGQTEVLIIAAPTQSYSPPESERRWGLFVPLYALHSRRSWGAGNFGDLARLGEWTAAVGGQVLATLPLTAAFLDCPTCEPSPYAPASRLFWNEFYLDLEQIPELARSQPAQSLIRSAGFRRKMSRFQGSGLIDYQAQMQARRNVLELLARGLFARPSARRDAFELFLRQRPELARYAAFRAATEKANCCWQNWPERQRGGELSEDDYAPAARDYHAFVQWLAQEQMEQLVAGMRARQVDLYLDLPLGVHPDGYDVWREQHLFALAASVGAPPDPFFSRGQNWGFPPLHPAGLRRDRYRYLLEYLRFQMRQTGLLRIDHVMGLHRLYWVPKGLPPDQGAYVTYPAEELYALLSLESHRHRTVLVGENLGTVPPAVNSSMDRHRLRRMSVVPFEQQPDPARALRVPPRRVVASLNTHDMPTFAAHWRGRDISDRHKLGLIAKNQVRAEQDQRRKLNAALAEFLRRQGHLHGPATLPAVWRACLRWLSATPSEIVLLNLEDAWGEEQPQNTPGTFRERPNWRRKLSRSVEEITSDQALADFLRELRRIRSGKTPTRPSRRASGLSA